MRQQRRKHRAIATGAGTLPPQPDGPASSVTQGLGEYLRTAGFSPLPDVTDNGELLGTRMWRVHAGYVECLVLRPNGIAHATRTEATFDYQQPTAHGPVIEHHTGHALNCLSWLLAGAIRSSRPRPRSYSSAGPGPRHDDRPT